MAQHFADGETFGVYGEILPASQQQAAKKEEDKIPVTILTGVGKGSACPSVCHNMPHKRF